MVPTFLLMLREGLEAALIVGIVSAYLVKIGRRDALPKVAAGLLAAVGVSILAGVIVVATVGRLPLVVQETLEGLAALAAVAVLTWMLFWMRRQGRAIKGELERGVEMAVTDGRTFALVGLVFIAVIREGLETVLFLIALISSTGTGADTILGGVLGLATAVGVGWAIFVGGVRINLRTFFTATGIVLIFVAAGLVAFSIAEFGEAGLFPNSTVAFNLNGVLADSTPLGSVLRGLIGYRSQPTVLELVGYLLYLVPVMFLFVADRPFRRRAPAAAS
ncbi:MAG TPA: iron uptake transporter permease EfeU [Candidatus Limnocylindrales bacterium]|nr:iron uptake transporter permease EfeU [Candidatus Limnocylindrales bacterium]